MFKPGGFLKKVFGNPIKAVHKAVTGTGKAVHKAASAVIPGGGGKQEKKEKVSNLAPKAAGASPRINPIAGGGASVGAGSAIGRRSGGSAGKRFGGSLSGRLGGHRKML